MLILLNLMSKMTLPTEGVHMNMNMRHTLFTPLRHEWINQTVVHSFPSSSVVRA